MLNSRLDGQTTATGKDNLLRERLSSSAPAVDRWETPAVQYFGPVWRGCTDARRVLGYPPLDGLGCGLSASNRLPCTRCCEGILCPNVISGTPGTANVAPDGTAYSAATVTHVLAENGLARGLGKLSLSGPQRWSAVA